MRVTVDGRVCIGAGMCVLTAPGVFDQAEDGRSMVLDADPPIQHHDRVREAEQVCPAGAIRLGGSR